LRERASACGERPSIFSDEACPRSRPVASECLTSESVAFRTPAKRGVPAIRHPERGPNSWSRDYVEIYSFTIPKKLNGG
jgi:hypothetical protein